MASGTAPVLFLDTSALLASITDGPARALIIDAMHTHDSHCASELALAEAAPALDRLTEEQVLREELEDAFRRTWDWLFTVPVDRICLDDAAQISRDSPARLADAIHIAAAMRLPGPVTFATVDPVQIGLAEQFGLTPICP